jgi:AbrB family looped-hinge helix DNA binding protein
MGKKSKEYIHTVTKLGTITIPVPIRKKYGITKGSKLKIVDTEDGIKLIPIVTIKNMFGVDKEKEDVIKELLEDMLKEE